MVSASALFSIFNGLKQFLSSRKENKIKRLARLLRNYAEKIQREHGGSPCFTKELLAAQLGNDADALDVVLEFMEEKGWASNFIAGYWRIGGSSYQEPHRWAAERWT